MLFKCIYTHWTASLPVEITLPSKAKTDCSYPYSPPFGCAGAIADGTVPKPLVQLQRLSPPLFLQWMSAWQGWRFYGWGRNCWIHLCMQKGPWNHRVTLRAVLTVTGFLSRITWDYFSECQCPLTGLRSKSLIWQQQPHEFWKLKGLAHGPENLYLKQLIFKKTLRISCYFMLLV